MGPDRRAQNKMRVEEDLTRATHREPVPVIRPLRRRQTGVLAPVEADRILLLVTTPQEPAPVEFSRKMGVGQIHHWHQEHHQGLLKEKEDVSSRKEDLLNIWLQNYLIQSGCHALKILNYDYLF